MILSNVVPVEYIRPAEYSTVWSAVKRLPSSCEDFMAET